MTRAKVILEFVYFTAFIASHASCMALNDAATGSPSTCRSHTRSAASILAVPADELRRVRRHIKGVAPTFW